MTELTAAKITNINFNNDKMRKQSDSINSSLSSSCSSSSYSIHQQQTNLTHTNSVGNNQNGINDYEKENDSGIEKDDTNTIFVRVSINDQNLQKVLKFNLDETVWTAKQRVLATLAKEVKDGLNYGFYLPPFQGRAGKFLDDCRKLKEYSLNGPVAQLEFKYKKRVYKFIKINQKELKALNVKSNYKKFLDLIRMNQIQKVARYLEKGLDPNFHSDLGETPLTLAVSLCEPRNMIMTLYNGGAHLDFRSRDTLTPMHKAAIIGNDKALKTLLELGAFAEVRDGRMLTPLYYSILNSSSIQSIEYLLFNGSTIGIKDDNNWQEIHHACKLGLSQHLDHLIYYGCDINAKNNSGNTPLHVCAIHNQENCARILLFRGCNRNERNLANQTAYDSAVIAGNQLIADLIKSHREADIVPIKERPFYNTKRRSIYVNTLTSSATSNTICEWTYNKNISPRAYSMSKLDNIENNTNSSNQNFYAVSSATFTDTLLNKPVNTAVANVINSGSSSPTSRSRSISSDDHGFGSASLSQISNAPQIVEYSYARKRLYPSIPNRSFICTKGFRPTQPGEIELKKGDIVELLSVGDSGFWEGRLLSGNEGWFKASCVEEFIVPKDSSQSDTIVVKRKTLFDLITNTDIEAPRTVVLQKGKKGFGFVLRGAKTNDGKFEPSLDCPALQFLESVDKDSNAEKAGLKPLDFVLEINGVDVTCKTHLECVKLIKKTGDTLALKVYTSKNFSSFATNLTNLTSTSAGIYQTPSVSLLNTSVSNSNSITKSHSYYATSTITTNNLATMSNEYHTSKDFSSIYFDGTKSLPNKKKPIPPKRDPSTSLTLFSSNKNNLNSSTISTTTTTNNNNFNTITAASLKSKSSKMHNRSLASLAILSTPLSFKSPLSRKSCASIIGDSSPFWPTQEKKKAKNKNENNKNNNNNDSLTYINCVLAQIDELDKTLAEYDTTLNNNLNSSLSNEENILLANKTKLLANDANAASIRTRVPVRKPGINNGEIFNPVPTPNLSIHQKTMSVPNLFQASLTSPTPAPPPPTVPSIPHITHSSKNRNTAPLAPTPNTFQNSASSDTLINQETNTPDSDPESYEPPNDYEDSNLQEEYDESYSTANNEPAVDYDDTSNTSMSTFTKPNNNLIMMMINKNATSSSPLTPRQIKQRNTAKRNSIPKSLSPTQQIDLAFLQSQKFDQEFIQTTKELFVRYPTAKISLSVTVASSSQDNQLSESQTRQIEIDRFMFEKLTANANLKIQPQTPIRTTSVLTNTLNNSISSSSPSSGSTSSACSSSVYESPPPPPPPLCSELIAKKKQLIQTSAVKNELERALENRLRRISCMQQETTAQDTNILPPPPSPSALHRLSKIETQNEPKTPERFASPPPPPPPLPPSPKSIQNAKPIKTNVNNNYILMDPRSSSDFSELIAKKAAEKRAKFQETKPTLNAVTFQHDGSKTYHTKPKANKSNANALCSSTNNEIENSPEEIEMNLNRNSNESFINTASKLLEKVKQQQHQQQQQNLNNQHLDETNLVSKVSPAPINKNQTKPILNPSLIQIK